MQILITIALIIIGILLFEFIIFAHEFGHFITAKRSGVQVNEFSLGMGPKLFGFKKGETQYSLRLFPIGGYCAMEGEDSESANPRAFVNAKIWKRMIIIVAGAVMNFIIGFLLMFVFTIQAGQFESTVVSSFVPSSFTQMSGLQIGDKIAAVDGYSILNIRDLQFAIMTRECKDVDPHSVVVYKEDCANALVNSYLSLTEEKNPDDETINGLYNIITKWCGNISASDSKDSAYACVKAAVDEFYTYLKEDKPKNFAYPEIKEKDKRQRFTADLTVLRDGKKVTLEGVQFYSYYKDEADAKANKPSVAFDFYVEPIEKNIGSVIEQTFTGTVSLAKTVWQSLVMLVTGRFSVNDMSGPIGITTAVSYAASQGLETGFMDAVNNIIFVMALITVNLGVFNLLPFPALDGGRFVFLLIEAIFRKPVPRKIESIVNAAGLAVLLLFIALISVKDIWQLITGTMPGM